MRLQRIPHLPPYRGRANLLDGGRIRGNVDRREVDVLSALLRTLVAPSSGGRFSVLVYEQSSGSASPGRSRVGAALRRVVHRRTRCHRGAAEATYLTARVELEDGVRVVHLAGELDQLAGEAVVMSACLDDGHRCVCVDMRRLTFMDCGGYGCLVAVERQLRQRGGALTVRNAHGAARRLLVILGHCPV